MALGRSAGVEARASRSDGSQRVSETARVVLRPRPVMVIAPSDHPVGWSSRGSFSTAADATRMTRSSTVITGSVT
jgi:hypothetical protein